MKNRQRNLIFIVFIALFVQGCATIMQGSTQQITVNSSPAGATVLVDGGLRFTTPAVLELSRKDMHQIEISLDGYHSEMVDLRPVSSTMVAGNLIVGGLIGYMVDQSTGGALRLVPDVVQVNLRPITPEAEKTPAAVIQKVTDTTNQQ